MDGIGLERSAWVFIGRAGNGQRAEKGGEWCSMAWLGRERLGFFTFTKSSMIKLESLSPNAENPRKIDKKQMERLKRSLQEFEVMMSLRPMVVDETFKILGGNMRYFALQALGYKEVPDEWVKQALGLTEDQKREFIVKDNISFGDWDLDVLANWDLGELADWGLDIPAWVVGKEAKDDGYPVPDRALVHTNFKQGDLIEIGAHRLLCGDSTNPEDVERLLNGSKPYIMVTDPPYGVEYDANWRNEADRSNGKAIGASAIMKVKNDDNADWSKAIELSPCKVAYVWYASLHSNVFQDSLEKSGFIIRSQIIWVKSNIVISQGHYHWKHEPCWYAVRKGSGAAWVGDRKQNTVWEIPKPKKSETGHSTQKPVECMARPIQNHDGAVYDPFVGSGTTIIGCEQLGRICYAMDIDPKFCQITVDRALAFNPNLTVRVNGEPYVPPISPEEGS